MNFLHLFHKDVEFGTTELEKDDDALKKAIRKMKELGGGY